MTAKINIHAIREHKGQVLKGSMHLTSGQLLGETALASCWEDIVFDYQVTNADELFLLEGKLTASYVQPCSRCLVQARTQVERQLLEKFARQPVPDEEIFAFRGDELDLIGLLREHLLLAAPLKVVCGDSCQGLCPGCGQNLNENQCDCNFVAPDPRLAALEKLLPPSPGNKDNE